MGNSMYRTAFLLLDLRVQSLEEGSPTEYILQCLTLMFCFSQFLWVWRRIGQYTSTDYKKIIFIFSRPQ